MPVAQLSDRSVVLSLQEIAQELGDELGSPADSGIADARDAEELLAALFTAAGEPEVAVPADEPGAVAAGRRLLELLAEDDVTGELARSVLADPPQDDQLAVNDAVTGVVVLAAVVSWLQTKVSFRFHRDREGRREIEFSAEKTTDPKVLRQVVRVIRDLLLPPPPPPPLP
ncbi:hypothetical protein [Streptomyces sp. NPDC000410]|uniref:hypothetical protein n=1 Tax=Streptomyces sp. NPDC000410 TaxID=3154254 RepID=UPI003328AFB5